MKKFLFIMMCLMTLCVGSSYAQNKKYINKFDKNTKKIESERYEYSTNQFDCNISFWILIDDESSRKDVFLALTFFSKFRENIECDGNLVIGQKGNPLKVIDLYNVKRSMSEQYYKTTVYYPIEDLDEFFSCNKYRVQTKMSNVDIILKQSEVKVLNRYYEATREKANQIFNVNTDITYGF